MNAAMHNRLWPWIFACLLIAPIAAVCQPLTNRMNRSLQPVIRPSQPVIRPPVTVMTPSSQPEPMDPLLALMMQQANTDTNVIADAEFDPPTVCAGERTTYRVVVTALSEAVVLPDKLPFPPGLTYKEGGRGMAYASAGQALQYRTTFNFHLTPNTAGTYAMPSFSVTGNGRQVAVPPKQLVVLPSGFRPPASRPVLTAQLMPGDYFIGQSVPVLAILAEQGPNGSGGLILPQVKGDSLIIDQSVNRQWREVRDVNGVRMPVVIHEMAAIPIAEGKLELTVQAFVPQPRIPSPAAISLPSYYPLYDSESITLTVKHLPKQGELPGFTGLVGTFKINQPTLSSNEVHAGNPVFLSVSVAGQGNLSRLVPPRLDNIPGWQAFPAVPDPNPAQLIQIFGSNTFGYALVPMSDRIKATPRIPFSYFDPKKMAYVDLSIPSLPIRVLKPLAGGAVAPANEMRDGEERVLSKTESAPVLVGIVTQPGKSRGMEPLHRQTWFLALQLFPALGVAGLWGWDRRRRFLAMHPDVVLKRRARRGLRRQRRKLRRAAARGDSAGFVQASVNALREVCAPHLPANPQALVCGDVLGELPPEDRQGPAGSMVRALFQTADAIRFVEKTPTDMALLALRPQLELLLEQLRRRL